MIPRPLAVLILGLGIMLCGCWSAPSTAPSALGRHTLDPAPTWIDTATWSHDGASLVLVDPAQGKLLRYAPDGRKVDDFTPSKDRPAALQTRSASEYLLENANGAWSILDTSWGESSSIQMVRTVDRDAGVTLTDLCRGSTESSPALIGIFGWTPVHDGLLAVGDFCYAGEDEVSVVFRSGVTHRALANDAGSPPEKPLETFDPTSSSRIIHLLGYPYLATIGDTGYILRPRRSDDSLATSEDSSSTPYILQKIDFGQSNPLLTSVPLKTKRPLDAIELPTSIDFSAVPAVYQRLEQQHMPSALIAWQSHLYVLLRVPAEIAGGPSDWQLAHVDPKTGEMSTPCELSVSAHHVTVAPGETAWAFVERGIVHAVADQDIESMFLVSAASITEACLPTSSS